MPIKKYKSDLRELAESIKILVNERRKEISRIVNNEILLTYWEVGKMIIERETKSNIDQKSSRALILELSKMLSTQIGKGFNRSNLTYMRLFYLKYPSGVTLSHQQSWSHYIEFLKIDDEFERGFYERQSVIEKWSVRELRRQKDSALFQRLALSKDKEGILRLSQEGQIIDKEEDLVKDPYVLEFLGLPEQVRYTEKQLEAKIIENLQKFLLELGKGFAFLGSQYRITLNNTHFYVDLVFYHRILKCFVAIDLKIGEVKHMDIGQMNMYLNYFKEEENVENDNPPIGIILAASKDEIMIKYATGGLSNKVFVSKYQTYLPEKNLLQERVRKIIEEEKEASSEQSAKRQ
ncbi:MAG: PDDEXK nuclease domain-containing protein [Bacteroidota bacterium]